VFFTPGRLKTLKRNFEAMLEAANGPIHPKMARELEKGFTKIDKIGGDIYKDLHTKRAKRTWVDSTPNTMFLS
jgi:hypothetical protein